MKLIIKIKLKFYHFFILFQRSTKTDYLFFDAKKASNLIQNKIIEALVFHHFYLKCLIYIKTNTSQYVIDKIIY